MLKLNITKKLFPVSEQELEAIHAATDITGFGLAGHAYQMASASQKTFSLNFQQLPVFSLAWTSLKESYLTKAHRTNALYTESHIQIDIQDQIKKLILFDPQTSGGLLLAVNPQYSAEILKKISMRFKKATQIGQVLAPQNKSLLINS